MSDDSEHPRFELHLCLILLLSLLFTLWYTGVQREYSLPSLPTRKYKPLVWNEKKEAISPVKVLYSPAYWFKTENHIAYICKHA